MLQAWFASDDACGVGPWRYLDAQIKEGSELSEAIAEEWCRSNAGSSALVEEQKVVPVGAPSPRARFALLAEQVGVVRPGDPMDQNQVDFALAVVDLCASIGDRYGDSKTSGNAGEHIRAELRE